MAFNTASPFLLGLGEVQPTIFLQYCQQNTPFLHLRDEIIDQFNLEKAKNARKCHVSVL